MKLTSKLITAVFLISVSSAFGTSADTEYLRHPAGLEFKYPSEWTVKEAAFADVELVPPDQSMSAQGPTEAYFVCGLGLDPSKAAQEQIAEQLNVLMNGIASFLKPEGEPEAFLGKRVQGLLYTYEGKRPDGFDVRSRIFVLPEKNVAFALVALGLRENIVKREASVSEIFSTFLQKAIAVDPDLIGLWITHENEISSVQTQTAESERNEMQLEADGSFITLMQTPKKEGLNNTVNSGRWYSRGSRLYFVSAGNQGLMFRYELTGERGSRKLSLIHPNGDRQDFHEVQTTPD
jgi:hypothetical protein